MGELIKEGVIKFTENEFKNALAQVSCTSDAGELWREILKIYSETWRSFHNLKHISDTIAAAHVLVRHTGLQDKEKVAVILAVAYHDIIYNTKSPSGQNEKESAKLAVARLSSVSSDKQICRLVYRAILATDHSRSKPLRGKVEDIVHDADLFSLSRHWNKFLIDSKRVQEEYSHLTDTEFARGRKEFMQKLLERPSIYYTRFAVQKWEQKARQNLIRLTSPV